MKRSNTVIFFLLLTASLIVGCAPVVNNPFADTWTTNVGKLSFTQNGTEIIGAIHGYGGGVNQTFAGIINENGEAVFSTEWFGEFTLILVGDAFKSKSPDLAFCGIRTSVTDELPSGCGFSGKWLVPSKNVFLPNSYMILKQVGAQVTGDLYSGNDNIYESFKGEVSWGKGWRANGTFSERGEVILAINGSETGFEFLYGKGMNSQQLCAFREGQPSAYIGYFTCEP